MELNALEKSMNSMQPRRHEKSDGWREGMDGEKKSGNSVLSVWLDGDNDADKEAKSL